MQVLVSNFLKTSTLTSLIKSKTIYKARQRSFLKGHFNQDKIATWPKDDYEMIKKPGHKAIR